MTQQEFAELKLDAVVARGKRKKVFRIVRRVLGGHSDGGKPWFYVVLAGTNRVITPFNCQEFTKVEGLKFRHVEFWSLVPA